MGRKKVELKREMAEAIAELESVPSAAPDLVENTAMAGDTNTLTGLLATALTEEPAATLVAELLKFDYLKIEADFFTLGIIEVDESGSMRGSEGEVVAALNAFIAQLKTLPNAKSIIVGVVAFGSKIRVMRPMTAISEMQPFDYGEYRPFGETPLYTTSFASLAALSVLAGQLAVEGITSTSIVYGVSDGNPEEPIDSKVNADLVKQLLKHLQTSKVEGSHVRMGLFGIGSTGKFYATAQAMGIADQDIAVDPNGDLTKILTRASQGLKSASQGIREESITQ